MENEKKVCEQQTQNEINSDDDEIVTIDYYDYINKQWIKVDVTKKVARFLETNDRKTKRKQAQYDYRNISYHKVFNENKARKINERIIDVRQEPDYRLNHEAELRLKDAEIEHQRTIIQNSLCKLTEPQKEVIDLIMYDNLSHRKIARKLNIAKSSVTERVNEAKTKIINYIKNGEKH